MTADWTLIPRALRRCGLEIEELIQISHPTDPTTPFPSPFVTLEWAQMWPCEEVWKARPG